MRATHANGDPDAASYVRAYAYRDVFECAVCGEAVTWPVSREPQRPRGSPQQVPSSGRYRTVTRRDGTEVILLPYQAARLPTAGGVKQARTCPNDHYVGDLRVEPHSPPWYLELRCDLVTARPAATC